MHPRFSLPLIALLFLAACGSDDEAETKPAGLDTLATDSLAAGWRPLEPPRKYHGDALFDYFAGNAAIYREYGCRQVLVQDYANADGDEVRVEVFVTEAPAGAYGLFSLKTQPGGELVDVGVQGWKETFTLNFWRGDRQVTLKARKVRGTEVKRMEFLAVSVDQGLRGEGDLPRIMSVLPEKDLLPKGRVFIAGPAGLRQALGRDPWEFPPPVRGALGNYAGLGGEHQLLVLEYETPEQARAAGKAAAPEGSMLNERHTRMLVVLPEEQGRFLCAYIGPKNPEQARVTLTRAVQELARARL